MASLTINRTEDGTDALDRNGAISAKTIKYEVYGSASKGDMLQAVFKAAPRDIAGMVFDGVEVKDIKEGYAEVYANYKSSADDLSNVTDSSGATLSFSCSQGSAIRKKAIRQTSYGKAPNHAPESNGFIAWNGKPGPDAEVAGVEIVIGTMRETYTKLYNMKKLDTPFRRNIARLVGKVNSSQFKGWAQGEVLFLGADFSGQLNSSEKIAVSYHFAISENETNIPFGDGSVPHKKGWEYIWSIFDTSPADKQILVKTLGIYVAQVYTEVDFGRLGLGV